MRGPWVVLVWGALGQVISRELIWVAWLRPKWRRVSLAAGAVELTDKD